MINTYVISGTLSLSFHTTKIQQTFYIPNIFEIFFLCYKTYFFRLNFCGNIWKIKIFYYRKIFKIFMLNFKNF